MDRRAASRAPGPNIDAESLGPDPRASSDHSRSALPGSSERQRRGPIGTAQAERSPGPAAEGDGVFLLSLWGLGRGLPCGRGGRLHRLS